MVQKLKWPALLAFSMLGVVLIKLWILLKLQGGWEPDEYMHLLQLKTIYTNFPQNLELGLTTWAKPLYSYLLGLVVHLFPSQDLLMLRLTNVLIFAAISYFVYLSVKKLINNKLIAWWAMMFTLVSFNLWRSSLSGLTEGIFTLLIVSSFYLLLSKKYLLAMLLVGLSVLGRIEGLFFVLAWLIYIFATVKPKLQNLSLLVVIGFLPTVIWNLIGAITTGRILYLLGEGYFTVSQGAYGFGSVTHFAFGLLSQEAILMVLFGLSLLVIFKNRTKLESIFAPIVFMSFVLIQTMLWVFSILGSAGLPRYLVCVLPFAIIGASYFWQSYLQGVNKKVASAILVVCLAAQFLFTYGTFSRGGNFQGLENRSVQIAAFVKAGDWIEQNLAKEYLYSDRPEVIYYAGYDLNNADINLRAGWESGQKGIYVWSKSWGEIVYGLKQSDFASYKQVANFDEEIIIFQKD